MTRQALGKGLDALLPPISTTPSALLELELDRLKPCSLQPRLRVDPEKLEELAASIRENGVLQPIVVRQAGDGYEIVAGERRWRAAQRAGLERIPAIIQDVSDGKMLELALVENIQRDELGPIEEAQAYRLLTERFGLTQDQVAQRVGRSRAAITNMLRLLRLPGLIQEKVINGEITMGHARALLPLPEKVQVQLVQLIAGRGLSVRDVERRVRRLQNPVLPREAGRDANLAAAEQKLEERLKTRVDIRVRGGKGRITLHFHSAEELQRLYADLLGSGDG